MWSGKFCSGLWTGEAKHSLLSCCGNNNWADGCGAYVWDCTTFKAAAILIFGLTRKGRSSGMAGCPLDRYEQRNRLEKIPVGKMMDGFNGLSR